MFKEKEKNQTGRAERKVQFNLNITDLFFSSSKILALKQTGVVKKMLVVKTDSVDGIYHKT